MPGVGGGVTLTGALSRLYAITFLISFDISFDFEMKRKKTKSLFASRKKGTKRGKKKKNFGTCPPGVEPGPADSSPTS